MKSTLVLLSLLVALVSLPTVHSLGQCLACPEGCSSCTWDNGFVRIVSSQRGYSIDQDNQICYESCSGSQYYNPIIFGCDNCPEFCTGCRLSNGFLNITGARSGYSIDYFSGICYQSCKNGEYYDSNQRVCVSCPQNCGSCSVGQDGLLVINNAQRGYVVDPFSATCYAPCASGDYYNPISLSCTPCPCGTCSYDDGILTILTLPQGFSQDPINGGCYQNCPSGKYYSFQSRTCLDCPSFCTSCYLGLNGIVITSAIRGYAIDTINAICYLACQSFQYYDYNSLQCFDCPQGCTECYLSRSRSVVITGWPSGWVVDSRNNICYEPCSTGFYYNPNFLSCSPCPNNCVACTFYELGNAPVNVDGSPINAGVGSSTTTGGGRGGRGGRGSDAAAATVDIFADYYDLTSFPITGAFWILTPRDGYTANNFDGTCYQSCTEG